MQFFRRYKTVILYGGSLAALLFLLRWLQIRLLFIENAYDVYVGSIALFFMGLGVWLALKLRPDKNVDKVVAVPNSATEPFEPDAVTVERLGLSGRELEVLVLMAEGLSNQEIADRLFVSLNTVKTHTSRVYEKLGVRRRTQAVELARRVGVLR